MNPNSLRRSHLFATLSEEQLTAVTEGCRTLKLSDGQLLFEAGQPAGRFYFVESGQIKLYRLSPDGAEKVIDIVSPGSTFAEALMFLDHPVYPVSASALHGAKVVSFDNRRFLTMLEKSVETCFKIMGTMSQRLRGLIKEIDDLTLQSATTRLCSMLWGQVERSGNPNVELKVPKGVLASRLSIKPETFSRILHNLTDQGVIEVKGAKIRVMDMKKLQGLAHTDSLIGLSDRLCCHN